MPPKKDSKTGTKKETSKKTTTKSNSKFFCGYGPVPRGKERGTPEQCVAANQIRYYGFVKIDPRLMETMKTSDLVKEQMALKKLEGDGQLIIKNHKRIKMLLSIHEPGTKKHKAAEKQLDDLLKKRDKLLVKIRTQKKVVENAEKEHKLREKSLKKTTSKKTVAKKPAKSSAKTSKKSKTKK